MQRRPHETRRFAYPVHLDPQVNRCTPALRSAYFQLSYCRALQSSPSAKMGAAHFVTMEIAGLYNCPGKPNPRRRIGHQPPDVHTVHQGSQSWAIHTFCLHTEMDRMPCATEWVSSSYCLYNKQVVWGSDYGEAAESLGCTESHWSLSQKSTQCKVMPYASAESQVWGPGTPQSDVLCILTRCGFL